eukprot:5856560-Alexandrium_andersonii.AAC.1
MSKAPIVAVRPHKLLHRSDPPCPAVSFAAPHEASRVGAVRLKWLYCKLTRAHCSQRVQPHIAILRRM